MTVTPKYFPVPTGASRRTALLLGGALLLAACDRSQFDVDMRGLGNGFDTSAAAASVPGRPSPDERGVISYPNTQVVLARQGENVAAVAQRLGVDAAELARFNGVAPDTILRRDELLALPNRVAEPVPGGLAAPTTGVAVTDLASAAIDQAETATATGVSTSPEPVRHRVAPGETVYSIARSYAVPVTSIAEWNGLGADLAVREGQQLLIPRAGASTLPQPTLVPGSVTEPGAGTLTPLPPSASDPLPQEPIAPAASPEAEPESPAPDLGEDEPDPPAASARLIRPVDGPIIRAYSRGRSEGIDIGAAPGTAVKAADSGTVAAITQDTDGASIVVVRHEGNLLTVYVNVTDVEVNKDDSVSRGQTIARIAQGDPSYLHFETREGLQSVDPSEFLP